MTEKRSAGERGAQRANLGAVETGSRDSHRRCRRGASSESVNRSGLASIISHIKASLQYVLEPLPDSKFSLFDNLHVYCYRCAVLPLSPTKGAIC